MAQVKWRDLALQDANRLYTFINNKDPEVAAGAAICIIKGADLLVTSPRLGRPMPDDTGRRELFYPLEPALMYFVT